MNKALIISFSLLVFFSLAYSQNELPAPSQVDLGSITLEEAISLGLAHSTEISKTTISLKDSETRLSEETPWNWLRPNVSLGGGADVGTGQPRLSVGVGLDLRDILGAGEKRIKTIKFSISEGKKNLDAIKTSISIKVTAAYKGYRVATEKVKTLEEMLQNDEGLTNEPVTGGTKVEKLLIRSMINQDRVALITARQELAVSEANLRELLGAVP